MSSLFSTSADIIPNVEETHCGGQSRTKGYSAGSEFSLLLFKDMSVELIVFDLKVILR